MKKKTKKKKPKERQELTPKMQIFCQEFLADINATQAAIRAGYSKKTARSQGQRLLTKVDVQAEIQRLMDKRAARSELTADRVLCEIMKLAFSNIGTYVHFDEGELFIKKPSDEFTDDELACISQITKVVTSSKYGKKETKTKFKLYDKESALELLGKHLKLFGDQDPAGQAIHINVNLKGDDD